MEKISTYFMMDSVTLKTSTKEYFESGGLFLYNKLTNSFPEFDYDDFSDYILSSNTNVNLINHYFHSIYPIIKNSSNIEHISSRLQMINLLNSISHDALVLLWSFKLDKIFEWYCTKNEIDSYFELIDQNRLANLIIYLYNLEMNKSDYPIYYQNALRLASGLLIYLKAETISIISEHEYFLAIYENYEKVFTEKEIELIFKINPELVNFFKSKHTENENFRYLATLHVSDKADILSIINLLQIEFDTCVEMLNQGFTNKQGNFYIKNSKVGIKYEYIIEMIELFPENTRLEFLKELFKIDKISNLLTEPQKESLNILINENFKTLNQFRTKKLF